MRTSSRHQSHRQWATANHTAWMIRSAASLLSGGRANNRHLLVLCYHRVLPEPDFMRPYEMHAEVFEQHMAVLRDSFTVLPLANAIRLMQEGQLPRGAVSITFDDGYADNVTVALPILRKHGLEATVFVAAGFLDGGQMWNDSIREIVRRVPCDRLDLHRLGLDTYEIGSSYQRYSVAERILAQLKYFPLEQREQAVYRLLELLQIDLPNNLMMSSRQLTVWLAAGMDLGAHTMHHPILTTIPADKAIDEIVESKVLLEERCGRPVRLFAYPNGRPVKDYDRTHIKAVQSAGFEAALSTAPGVMRRGRDLFQIPRIAPWTESATRFGFRMASGYLRRRAACA